MCIFASTVDNLSIPFLPYTDTNSEVNLRKRIGWVKNMDIGNNVDSRMEKIRMCRLSGLMLL